MRTCPDQFAGFGGFIVVLESKLNDGVAISIRRGLLIFEHGNIAQKPRALRAAVIDARVVAMRSCKSRNEYASECVNEFCSCRSYHSLMTLATFDWQGACADRSWAPVCGRSWAVQVCERREGKKCV